MRAGTRRNRVLAGAAALAVLTAIPVVGTVRSHRAQAAAAQAGDGTSTATAGASCWGIKQQYPASASGIYWLNTAALERPTQFYCDMTTDGGGWVLVARGRQGWSFTPTGQGSPASIRNTPDGTGAFSPAALSSATIAQLLNGTAVKDLADGIRLERARSTDGTQRQDYRLFPTWKKWTWSFDAGQLLDKVVVDGRTYNGSNTYDTSASVFGQTTNALSGVNNDQRLFTFPWSSHNNQQGWSYGNKVNGSNASTSYLWTYSNESNAIPFTKVWVRPKVANSAAGFTPIPAGGYAAEAKPAQLKARSEIAPWGVVGIDHTGETTIEPYKTNVLSMRVAGDRVFVGGRFSGVQQGPTGTPNGQHWLAAFDLDGTYLPGFAPQLDGRVWDMVVAPDGNLIIGGDFTNVNGVPNTAGIAKLDPTTGAPVAGFKATAVNGTGRALVRALDIRGDTVYAGGRMNKFTGGDWAPITVTNAVSFSATTGRPGTWRPRPTAQVVRLRVNKAGTQVLLAGYFAKINGDANQGYYGITNIADGTPVAGLGTWTPSVGTNNKYQQAVLDLGDGRYIVGGSEHDFQIWNENRTQLLEAKVTKQGGDTQAIEQFGTGTDVYYACHCGNWVYEGTNNWSSPTGFRNIEPINLVTAVDPTTMEVNTSWYPSGLKGASGEGVWTIDQDSRGCLWVGGDLNRGAYSGVAATDWLGGFARFCREDSTPPSTPTSFTAKLSGSQVDLAWDASTDASGTVSYDIYKDDRVVATTYGTKWTDADVSGTHAYTVRAADARGNRSASPAPISVNGPATKIATNLAFGSTWTYRDDGTDQGTAWRVAGFDDRTWSSGAGQLGWGTTANATTLSATHPLTTYYRSTFAVADASQVKVLTLRTKVLTGAVFYVNGVEVGRYNMAPGPVTATSTAAGYLTAAQETQIVTTQVPGSVLKTGTNQVAVEVHNMRVNSSRGWFDLEATTYGAGGEANAPTAPVLTVAPATIGGALSWTPSTDDVAVGGYVIARDGQTVAVTDPLTTTWTDAVDTSTAHDYQVTAFDSYGNLAASNVATLAKQVDPNLLPFGSTWRWVYPTTPVDAAWNTVGFDDSTWASGPAELGFGDGDEKTIVTTAPTPRPITAYFRATIDVEDPTAFTAVVAQLVRDDGAIVYVNGVEVGRDNLPTGPVTGTTGASTILSTRSAETTPVTITIPSSAFVAGTNTIAVEVHNSDAWSGDLSFDLKLTGQK